MSDQIAYRVRHIPSGLWYKPGKKNLSKVGKIYPNKNTIVSFMAGYSHSIRDDQGRSLRVTAEDFELVPFKMELVELK